MAAELNPAPDPLNDRVLRVFVSSTFRDMKQERDLLAKETFPALRSECARRGVIWSEIDLRWGVSTEDEAEGRAMEVCLEEIRRCNCFIGILGERYGFVPSRERRDPGEGGPRFPPGKSITEREIEVGALDNAEMSGRCFFYLRDPAFLRRLPPGAERSDFESSEAADRANLIRLKSRVGALDPKPRPYEDPEELDEAIRKDFRDLIDRLFPEDDPPDPLEVARRRHAAYSAVRAHGYRPFGDACARLHAHAAGDGPPLFVTGEAGIGKSALLASWCREYRNRNPEAFVFEHFVGAEPGSADVNGMLRRCLRELNREFGLGSDLPDDPHRLRLSFANALHRAASGKPLVLVFDGLDRLEDRHGALDLVWVPRQLPDKVRMVLSAQPGRPLEAARARRWDDLTVPPMEGPETRGLLMEAYLSRYGKQKGLPPDLSQEILGARPAGNPLYLGTLLEELRLLGDRETLGTTCREYLKAGSPSDLLEKILVRWETDYARGRPGLVRDAMSYLLAARRGMTERELLDLLGTREKALPASVWSPLHLASESLLLNRNGVITFSHDLIRTAVERRWGRERRPARRVRGRLVGYFAKRLEDPRSVEELPWIFSQEARWRALAWYLADVPRMSRVWSASPVEVKEYWRDLREHRHDLRATYRGSLEVPRDGSDLLPYWHLSMLLRDTGEYEPALRLLESLASAHGAKGDERELARALGRQAVIRAERGDTAEADRLYSREQEICSRLADRDGLQRNSGNWANLRLAQGRLREAIDLHLKGLRAGRGSPIAPPSPAASATLPSATSGWGC